MLRFPNCAKTDVTWMQHALDTGVTHPCASGRIRSSTILIIVSLVRRVTLGVSRSAPKTMLPWTKPNQTNGGSKNRHGLWLGTSEGFWPFAAVNLVAFVEKVTPLSTDQLPTNQTNTEPDPRPKPARNLSPANMSQHVVAGSAYPLYTLAFLLAPSLPDCHYCSSWRVTTRSPPPLLAI